MLRQRPREVSPLTMRAVVRPLLVVTAMLLVVACAGEGVIGAPSQRGDAGVSGDSWADPPPPPRGDLALSPPPASDSGTASAADSQPGVPPGCPLPSEMVGSYSGDFKGVLKAFLPIPLAGTISFDVEHDKGAKMLLKNGKVLVNVIGMVFELPMSGPIDCGKMVGKGGATIAGVAFSGQFLATFKDGAFPKGIWDGKDVNSTSGDGTWMATRK